MKQLLFVFLFAVFYNVSAQSNGVLSGKVLDAEIYNEPLLMASLCLKGTSWKAQTNFNGNFEIAGVTPGKYTLQISFLGYETVEVPVEIKDGERLDVLQSLKAKSLPALPDSVVAAKEDYATDSQISGFKK
ncbi:carboxypeptidase-like regulatory domain-containing protein [Maribacter sp. MJ134]|uniref:carboxypeptidase-like regulatory domain-containing protein n=1 Tax=Maribacter sp. MJ134 TaxID=2496865 RepID=UPI000F846D08|nr:carboxypeptidase-like regulatory domain-containing protein [Maribacter sp. MJ134]AZQ59527.1 carboxypeptidase-like regulatory domain-containing protein [Maribacter sp. MJ134]